MIGLALVSSFSVYSYCRCGSKQAQAQTTADPVFEAAPEAVGSGGTHEDATYRFRSNECSHWRQITLGSRGSAP
jgi:hypothetical protein